MSVFMCHKAMLDNAQLFFKKNFRAHFFLNSIHAPHPPPIPGYIMVNVSRESTRLAFYTADTLLTI